MEQTGGAILNYSFQNSDKNLVGVTNIASVTIKKENDLRVTKEVQGASFTIGDTLNYVVSIKNCGVAYFTGIRVVENFGGVDYLSFVSGSARVFSGCECVTPDIINYKPLTISLSPLLPNQTIILTFSCKVLPSFPKNLYSIKNAVEVTGYTYNSTVTSLAECEIKRAKSNELKIIKSATSEAVAPGEIFSFNYKFENEGEEIAEVSSIEDSLPSGFKVVSVKVQEGVSVRVLNMDEYSVDGGNNFKFLAQKPSQKIRVFGDCTENACKTIFTITGYFGS